VHPEQPPVHADQFDVPHEPLGLHHVHLMTVMTENKLKTKQQEEQQEVKKWFLEPPFAVKNVLKNNYGGCPSILQDQTGAHHQPLQTIEHPYKMDS
jgi:hypothetical protein